MNSHGRQVQCSLDAYRHGSFASVDFLGKWYATEYFDNTQKIDLLSKTLPASKSLMKMTKTWASKGSVYPLFFSCVNTINASSAFAIQRSRRRLVVTRWTWEIPICSPIASPIKVLFSSRIVGLCSLAAILSDCRSRCVCAVLPHLLLFPTVPSSRSESYFFCRGSRCGQTPLLLLPFRTRYLSL